ncbi:MAG: hypothetical protein KYQ20_01530 [Candidatus Nealsonbacteria bacterium]|nr:hypothetical protein [Candidatus Nealsonbacteria bacterium]
MLNKKHYPLIRTIYLYLFSLIGLALLIAGGVRFLEMGLKAFVFTEVERQERLWHQQPPHAPWSFPMPIPEEIDTEKNQPEIEEKEICLSEAEKKQFDRWMVAFEEWEERRMEIDPVAVRRHREASSSLAKILIGLPLFLYHWSIIKKETGNKENDQKENKV